MDTIFSEFSKAINHVYGPTKILIILQQVFIYTVITQSEEQADAIWWLLYRYYRALDDKETIEMDPVCLQNLHVIAVVTIYQFSSLFNVLGFFQFVHQHTWLL